jgi:xylose isomerase
MLVILQAGGFTTGGINFDAHVRRNSTDPEDLFIAHVNGMDTFARAFIIADRILKESNYLKLRKNRYASFDKGDGALYEKGKLTLEDLRKLSVKASEPKKISGKQELYEQLINMYII